MREDSRTEFKREYSKGICKSVTAFANCEGGTIYIGIENDGRVVGVSDGDDIMLRVASNIRDSISPDVSLLADIGVIEMEDKSVVKIDITRGIARPYYLTSKGICPEGVYVRIGSATVPASSTSILELIRESAGYSYEEEVSINQELTFEYAGTVLADCGVPFDEIAMRNLGCINQYGQCTNLALLISDQCPHIIKMATFQGRDKMIFRDRLVADGCVFKQIETAMTYAGKYNRLRAEIVGYKRDDRYDYHLDCIRELLLNAVIHRDYSYDSPILISILDDRIEVVNIGGLYGGVSQEELGTGISVCRNKRLAEMFYRLELVEAFGTGIMKINDVYRDCSNKPSFTAGNNSFRAVLPNMNTEREDDYDLMLSERDELDKYGLRTMRAQPVSSARELDEREDKALSYIRKHGSANRAELESELGVSQATAILIIRDMTARNLIRRIGNGKNTRYEI